MLDWEERVFLGLKAIYERVVVRPERRRIDAIKAELATRRKSLLLLSQMLSGRSLGILETDERHLCGHGRVFLPASFAAAENVEGNAELYFLKTVLAAFAMRDDWRGSTPEDLRTFAERVAAELPAFGDRIRELESAMAGDDASTLWELLGMPVASAESDEEQNVPPAGERPEDEGDGPITEVLGKGRSNVMLETIGEDEGEGAETPMHTFEKIETLEEAPALSRKHDDEDELEEHQEALEQVEMRQLLRSLERPQSIYRSEVILDGVALEVAGDAPSSGIPYPEWHHRKGRYRENWCFVTPEDATDEDPEWVDQTLASHRPLIASLRRQFARAALQWELVKRQNYGSEFDIDAVIDAHVERRCGRTPTERIYVERRRRFHDVATLILVDLSYSTDAFVENQRVLDVIRETLLCAGEVLDEHIPRFAVAGFSSHTRRACRFTKIKGFDEAWHQSRARLGSLQAEGYTRIGPALRHATAWLEKQSAERKVILLITDGRPCDYDQYEGTHGAKDVKRAVEEADARGIATHAFAVDKNAHASFARMIPRSHLHIVTKPQGLPKAMCDLYAKLKTL